jgi:hypothetical protein
MQRAPRSGTVVWMKRLIAISIAVAVAAGVAAVPVGADAGPQAQAAKSKTRILCLNKAGTKTFFRKRPRTCAHFGPGGAFAGGVFLTKLRWKGFGRRTATARGRECGFHEPCENVKVSVKAYRLRKGCRNTRVYTRLRVHSKFGTTKVRMRTCTGPA